MQPISRCLGLRLRLLLENAMPQVRANGIDIEYESFGPADGPAVLLIAGINEQLTGWPDSLCHGLAKKGFRVIRFDNRDVGLSSHLASAGVPKIPELMAKLIAGQKLEVPYSLKDLAADAAGLLDALGIARAHIVGMSMGGMIAQLVAINFPAKTKSLVSLMSSSGRRGLPPPKPEAAAAMAPPAGPLDHEGRVNYQLRFFRAVAGPAYRPNEAELRAYVERQVNRAELDPAAATRHMAAYLAAEPRNEMLKTVRVPTLVLHGADDPLIPLACGKDTADSIPGAELVVVPGMGHDFSEAIVQKVYLKYIGDFLTKIETPAPVV
jgi:pimeloyl-ACP methyl ester carboxylesterase